MFVQNREIYKLLYGIKILHVLTIIYAVRRRV